ncbi:MAG: DNA replication/repair protein RecF [SAR86 cluster bacterium]|uniref:DNA replication and repair protein RecF n=1 Tax=SAR86 cluster bacterium TaxID=2030880 RepID=A0A2A4MST6_9GAMM|nr:MAG: DNA replication/repair protein RecF [SAR86 cluster bacterium]
MSIITRLNISSIRNLQQIELELNPRINLIFGVNGSGKTSLLEAIHLLSSGKSFRNQKIDPLIQYGLNTATVFAELDSTWSIGLSRSRNKPYILQLQGNKQANWEEVARLLPVQVLDSNAFLLLEGSPKTRRSFLDWGVFHVEQSFVENWRNTRKCIANRNLLLKQKSLDSEQLSAWDQEFCRAALAVHEARQKYFEAFLPVLSNHLENLLSMDELSLTYVRGWDERLALDEVLANSRSHDFKYGLTHYGPHRADIRIRFGKTNAVDVLSRGQQKLLVTAMKLAQGELLSKSLNRKCIFLVDDLPSELDIHNRVKVFKALEDLGGQVFLTCVEAKALDNCWESSTLVTRFHVEHGIIST